MSSHKDSLQHFKQPWAHDHEPVNNLVDVIKVLLPQVPFWFLGSYIIVDDKNAFSNSVCTNSSGLSTKEVVEAMANFNEDNLDKGMVYPPFPNIRKIFAHIAANVAAKAYELRLVSRYPHPKDFMKYAESFMYNFVYHPYR
ncbi:hypothetical protein ZIOFF_074962 [Zingiber officinale]|uniref:Uncharacterized protein n=1 Tax=Zingiber officinale TaxID=94328 RepID=A0A8J5B9K6_ZINOF|nr:hypothetical protein ZIOFF_074962 [Zingiber officinale]